MTERRILTSDLFLKVLLRPSTLLNIFLHLLCGKFQVTYELKSFDLWVSE